MLGLVDIGQLISFSGSLLYISQVLPIVAKALPATSTSSLLGLADGGAFQFIGLGSQGVYFLYNTSKLTSYAQLTGLPGSSTTVFLFSHWNGEGLLLPQVTGLPWPQWTCALPNRCDLYGSIALILASFLGIPGLEVEPRAQGPVALKY